MPSTFFEIDCGEEQPVTMEIVRPGEIIFHGWNPDEVELAAIELGFDPSPAFAESTCFIVWDAARREKLEDRLIQYAEQGRVDVVKTLIAAGAELHGLLRDNIEEALVAAAGEGHAAIVEILLAAGADVHAWYDMALIAAAEYGHADVVDILNAWIEEHG